ncbi:MAG: NUDIX domain-containing protein [Candidatus Coatesbacteria bacterium]
MRATIRSAGCVLYRRQGGRAEFLLIRNAKGHWDFPKGHVEPGESSQAAMRRETREETGLHLGSVEPGWTRRLRYRVREEGRMRPKTVLYRLAQARPGRVRLSVEHTASRWTDTAGALRLLGFANARRLLREAARRLAAGRT